MELLCHGVAERKPLNSPVKCSYLEQFLQQFPFFNTVISLRIQKKCKKIRFFQKKKILKFFFFKNFFKNFFFLLLLTFETHVLTKDGGLFCSDSPFTGCIWNGIGCFVVSGQHVAGAGWRFRENMKPLTVSNENCRLFSRSADEISFLFFSKKFAVNAAVNLSRSGPGCRSWVLHRDAHGSDFVLTPRVIASREGLFHLCFLSYPRNFRRLLLREPCSHPPKCFWRHCPWLILSLWSPFPLKSRTFGMFPLFQKTDYSTITQMEFLPASAELLTTPVSDKSAFLTWSYSSSMDCLIVWLMDWLFDWSVDWLIDRLIVWLINRLIDWWIDWLMDWWIDWWIDWLIK